MTIKQLGQTRLGLPIFLHQFSSEKSLPHLLIIGGVHGDEIEGVACAQGLLSYLLTHEVPGLQISVLPILNPEGVLLKTRGNSAGVDLNRNLNTKDWTADFTVIRYYPGKSSLSEPENQILVDLLAKDRPDFIISLHSYKPMLNINGPCPEAQVISEKTGYKIVPDIGYPTPGSLGTLAGHEMKIDTLTYEIERGLSLDQVIKVHVPAIVESFKITAQRKRL